MTTRAQSHTYLLAAFAAVVVALHIPHLSTPYFWDELGQFVPAALDILRDNAWIPHSTVPNVHPPGVMAYLALVWAMCGHSLMATRIAMLLVASGGLYGAFLLAIRMCRAAPGAPAFTVVVLLLATPLFYTQAMMAQLDMPAMALTTCALLLFLDGRYRTCAAVCTALVLVKETGILAPALFAAWLGLRERRWREAFYFTAPAICLAVWLVFLKHGTGHWLGDAGFTHYNVTYSLHPMRAGFALLRRVWFLFGADFRWIGTLTILYGLRRSALFRTMEWKLAGLFFAAHIVLVSLFGGATLERYLLPVLPILYIAVATGLELLPRLWRRAGLLALTGGMVLGFFWNPPYPFPFENNLAMVDFVDLQQSAAEYLEHEGGNPAGVATAWPYTSALRNPDLLFTKRPFTTVETSDFHPDSVISAVRASHADVLVLYSRTWDPDFGILRVGPVNQFLRRFYEYEPQITSEQIEQQLGLHALFRLSRHGQWVEVYKK